MSPIITGLALLFAIGLAAWLSVQLHNHSVAGYLEQWADRLIRTAVWLKAVAKSYRLFRAEWPRVFGGFHAELKREVGIL